MDLSLYPITELAGLGERDAIGASRINPADAQYIKRYIKKKIAT